MKFEKLAEIKIMYKNVDDPEKLKEKNEEIEQVKRDTENMKAEKLKEAQDLLVK